MDDFSEILEKATKRVSPPFFLLPISGGLSVQRERVYCYELYHQLRIIWTSSDYFLNGELDKGGHPKLKTTLGALKPDFLVHQPGSMDHNYAVMEVKPATPSIKAIRKDLKSISQLMRYANYERGLYLIYGSVSSALASRIADVAKADIPKAKIELWFHTSPGSSAERVAMLQTK